MSVREAQQRIDSREFSEWMAYMMVDPFGEERADLRAGIVASTVANVNRERGQKTLEPRDFMPEFKPDKTPQRKQNVEEMRARLKAFARAHNRALGK